MTRLSKVHKGMQVLPIVAQPDKTEPGAFQACLFSEEITLVTGIGFGGCPHKSEGYLNPCEGCIFSRPADFNELDKALRALL